MASSAGVFNGQFSGFAADYRGGHYVAFSNGECFGYGKKDGDQVYDKHTRTMFTFRTCNYDWLRLHVPDEWQPEILKWNRAGGKVTSVSRSPKNP